jgi:hypothetical protein
MLSKIEPPMSLWIDLIGYRVQCLRRLDPIFFACVEEGEEIARLPWRGQCDRGCSCACALCLASACCAAGYAKDCTGSPVRF